MPEPLKHFFNDTLVRGIAKSFAKVLPDFPSDAFLVDATRGLDDLETVRLGEADVVEE